MSDVWGALAGKAADLVNDTITGAINNYYGRKAGSRANNYALYMSSTAHQREVNDLRMAGLNPVLSALGNGAATVSVPVHGGQQPQTSSLSSHISANSARKVGEQQVNLLSDQQETEKTQQGLNNALANKAVTDSALNSARAQGEQIKNAIELMKSKYLRDASPHLRDLVINAMLTGSGSSRFGSIIQNSEDVIGSGVRSLKWMGQGLINLLKSSKSSDPNATQTHSSAKQMKKYAEGYEERKKWLENLRKESKYADGYEERKEWLEKLRKEL